MFCEVPVCRTIQHTHMFVCNSYVFRTYHIHPCMSVQPPTIGHKNWYFPRNGINILYDGMGDGIDRKVLVSTTTSRIKSESLIGKSRLVRKY